MHVIIFVFMTTSYLHGHFENAYTFVAFLGIFVLRGHKLALVIPFDFDLISILNLISTVTTNDKNAD